MGTGCFSLFEAATTILEKQCAVPCYHYALFATLQLPASSSSFHEADSNATLQCHLLNF
jgi:hypothetical protein